MKLLEFNSICEPVVQDSRALLALATNALLFIKQIPEIVPFPFKGQPTVVNLYTTIQNKKTREKDVVSIAAIFGGTLRDIQKTAARETTKDEAGITIVCNASF